MDEDTLTQFEDIHKMLRKEIYSINHPEMLLLDLDSTLLSTFGKQEGHGFNFHYYANGYHPLVCYDGLTEDLLKIQLKNGTAYSSTGVTEFLQPLLDEATATNKVDYCVCYGEFMYKAASWKYPRRVVCKVEKPNNQFNYMYTFIVTNMGLNPCEVIRFYCNRGQMENFIKESKNGFNFNSMSSSKVC